MMETFVVLNNDFLIKQIVTAKKLIIYAAPGMHPNVADTIIEVCNRNHSIQVELILDPDPEVNRLGYGDISSIEKLHLHGFSLRKTIGLRIGCIVIDDNAWVFSPTPLCIESFPKALQPNAIYMNSAQAKILIDSISKHPTSKDLLSVEPEIGKTELSVTDIGVAKKDLEIVPPQKFHLARVIRYYTAYIQFVETNLIGCHIGRHTISIPPKLLAISNSKNIQDKVRATFKLFDETSKLPNTEITKRLDEIRKKYLVHLGGRYGNVLLRQHKQQFEKDIISLKEQIEDYKKSMEDKLHTEIKKTIKTLASALAPHVKDTPPDDLKKQIPGKISLSIATKYSLDELEKHIPTASTLVKEMAIKWLYKDVTYEMLNDDDFIKEIKAKFMYVDWEKPFLENNAVMSVAKL